MQHTTNSTDKGLGITLSLQLSDGLRKLAMGLGRPSHNTTSDELGIRLSQLLERGLNSPDALIGRVPASQRANVLDET